MNIWRLPRESVEWVGPVTLDGDEGVLERALVPSGQRPAEADWKAPTTIGTERGLLVQGLAVGNYRLWARVTDLPEVPVFDDVATIIIT